MGKNRNELNCCKACQKKLYCMGLDVRKHHSVTGLCIKLVLIVSCGTHSTNSTFSNAVGRIE